MLGGLQYLAALGIDDGEDKIADGTIRLKQDVFPRLVSTASVGRQPNLSNVHDVVQPGPRQAARSWHRRQSPWTGMSISAGKRNHPRPAPSVTTPARIACFPSRDYERPRWARAQAASASLASLMAAPVPEARMTSIRFPVRLMKSERSAISNPR